MIISKSGKVVGKLNEETLVLTDVRSKKLQRRFDDWRENGFEEFGPAETSDYPEPKPTCAVTMITIPFSTENLAVIHNKLLIAGFDVQRD